MTPDISIVAVPVADVVPGLDAIYKSGIQSLPLLLNSIKHIIGAITAITIPISVVLLIGIIYSVERLKMIRKKEEEMYDIKVVPAYDAVDQGDPALAHRWEKIQSLISSQNESDWKQAIIQADIILDDLLNKMGYKGESVGEKLKRIEPSDFNTLNEAWEAHKVRNSIAHDATGPAMNEHQAKMVINLYKKVFEEFYYI